MSAHDSDGSQETTDPAVEADRTTTPASRPKNPGHTGRDDASDGEQGEGMRAQQVREDKENEDQDAEWQQ